MKYYIQRQLNEYGPYTLADLQRYIAQGNILLTDLARSEGMTEWVPVSQVIGNIPIPVPAPAMQTPQGYGSDVGYGYSAATGTVYSGAPVAQGPAPIDFHWALVLLLAIVSCGLFAYAWLIVEASFVRKIKTDSKALLFVILGVAGLFGSFFLGFVSGINHQESNPLGGVFWLAGLVLYLVGVFQLKGDMEEYYNSVEPINLQLSGVMTFFFNVYYFQYHMSRIAQWKRSGVLQPQG